MWGDDTESRRSDNRGNMRNNTVKTCAHAHTHTHTQCMPEYLKSIRILDCGLVGIQLSSDLHMHPHHAITQVPMHLVSTRAAQTPHPPNRRPSNSNHSHLCAVKSLAGDNDLERVKARRA